MRSKNTISQTNATIYLTISCNYISMRVTDVDKNLLVSRSFQGYIGSTSTAIYTADHIASNVARLSTELGINKVAIIIKGSGYAREAALSAIRNAGLEIITIKDITPVPHNGCRPPKWKRY